MFKVGDKVRFKKEVVEKVKMGYCTYNKLFFNESIINLIKQSSDSEFEVGEINVLDNHIVSIKHKSCTAPHTYRAKSVWVFKEMLERVGGTEEEKSNIITFPKSLYDYVERRVSNGMARDFIVRDLIDNAQHFSFYEFYSNNMEDCIVAILRNEYTYKEKKYRVKLSDSTGLVKSKSVILTDKYSFYSLEGQSLTEEEIKNYDERYLVFAEEID